MTSDAFYTDRTHDTAPRITQEISAEVWRGLVGVIRRRLGDGSLARAFPVQDCVDGPFLIVGASEAAFETALVTLIPALRLPIEQEVPSWASPRPKRILDPTNPPPTPIALDVVDFVMRHVATPIRREAHDWSKHEHVFFDDDRSVQMGRRAFRDEVELIFQRNGVAFTVSDYRVRRLGPPEARALLSEFAPRTGDALLDEMLRDAATKFLSKDEADRQTALEKLWDAFERLKTLEPGGNKKASAGRMLDLALPQSRLRDEIEAEFHTLTKIGNTFHVRHFEHDKEPLPSSAALDYLFFRLIAVIALVLRQTGRM